LISLTVDGQKIEQLDRADRCGLVGKHRDAEVAANKGMCNLSLLTDGIP